MKFQDSSFNGLKVTVGTKSVTHPPTHAPTHAPKAICPINFFKVGGIIMVNSQEAYQGTVWLRPNMTSAVYHGLKATNQTRIKQNKG